MAAGISHMFVNRVFIVIPTLTIGGAERVAAELLTQWSNQPFLELHLVLFTDQEIIYKIPETVVIHRLGFILKESNKYRKLVRYWRMILELRRLAKLYKPKFILSFMNKYNIFTVFSLFGLNQSVIVSERDSPTEVFSRSFVVARNIAYRFSKGLIAQTQSYKTYIHKQIPNLRVEVIYNPVREIPTQHVIKQNIILFVGRLEVKKGVNYLIAALAKHKNRLASDQWVVSIVGDGSERRNLESLVRACDLESIVRFEGLKTDVDEWFAKSKIFVLPSLMEGFPNALAEAMVSGLACISFDCETGPRELIESRVNGILVDVEDVNRLSDEIISLIESPHKVDFLSQNARLKSTDLNSKTICGHYFTFCDELSNA